MAGYTPAGAVRPTSSQDDVVSPLIDTFDPAAVAARQRAARRMADGIQQTFLTSSRGLEAPAGAGLTPPPPEEPIIASIDRNAFLQGTRRYAWEAAGSPRRTWNPTPAPQYGVDKEGRPLNKEGRPVGPDGRPIYGDGGAGR